MGNLKRFDVKMIDDKSPAFFWNDWDGFVHFFNMTDEMVITILLIPFNLQRMKKLNVYHHFNHSKNVCSRFVL